MSIDSHDCSDHLDPILDEFRLLFEKTSTKDLLQSFRSGRGGWELWLRNVAAASFKDVYVPTREESIYLNTRQRCDLWFEPWMYEQPEDPRRKAGRSQPYSLGIELKCQYEGNDPRKAFLEDVEKVLGGIKPQYIGRASSWKGQIGNRCDGTWIICLMVTMDERDLHDLAHNADPALKAKGQGQRFWHKKILTRDRNWRVSATPEKPSDKGPVDLWLIWWAKKWIRPVDGINDQSGNWTGERRGH